MIHIAAPFAGSLVGWRELLLFLMPVVGWTLDGHKYITIRQRSLRRRVPAPEICRLVYRW